MKPKRTLKREVADVRITTRIPPSVSEKIDVHATANGVSRSAIVNAALKAYLSRPLPPTL